ncbi:hypothetical protein DFH07DRAFT_769907 [Mycena maculata]|uniref:Uncharacterized protein n=1 Tax=Mycena maculata TaxID=230809 RepID=A0AAD7JL95_9AGAR|nr:hypothetical protein DFH07DRAFT_769907 [Mycena maculata]
MQPQPALPKTKASKASISKCKSAAPPSTKPKPPPMGSKRVVGPTHYEIQLQRDASRWEKARLRMAKKRAELKLRPQEEQEAAAARAREHQTARHREDLRIWEAQRRVAVYKARYGLDAYKEYVAAKRERRRQARDKRRAMVGLSVGKASDGREASSFCVPHARIVDSSSKLQGYPSTNHHITI